MKLSANFFRCQPLSDSQIEQFREEASTIAKQVVLNSQLIGGRHEWQLLSDEKGFKLHKATDPDAPSGANLHCGTTQVLGTVDEVAELFRSETTDEAKEACERFSHRLLDAVVLYSIEKPSPSQPHDKIGITWRAFESPGGSIIQNRDTCVVECHREIEWRGKRGWVCALKSVEIDCCPDLEDMLGLVRMQNYGSGYVVMESDRPGYLDISYITHVDVCVGKSEWFFDQVLQKKYWIADISMKKRCKNIMNIDRFLREQRLCKSPFITPLNFIPIHTRQHCHVCSRKFGTLSRKTNCSKCGEVVCHQCHLLWKLKIDKLSAKVKVCTMCSAPSVSSKVKHTRESTFGREASIDTVSSDPWLADEGTEQDREFDQWLATMERR